MAASLQQRVLAQMKIKEERDERQKRAEISPIHNGSVTITPTAHIKTEGKYQNRCFFSLKFHYGKWQFNLFSNKINSSVISVSNNLKRTSPIVQNHRPAKIRPQYGNHISDSLLSPNENHRDLMSPEINSIRSEQRAHIRPKHDDG